MMVEQVTEVKDEQRGWWATRWLRFALAVTFLTRLPLPIRGEVRPEDLRASMFWYPLIGLALGTLGYVADNLACLLFSPMLAAVLVVVLLELCSGALHLDGLMDTCDGVGSGKPRARMLEIMKDSRVGAMGVFGAIAVMLVKVTALSELPPPFSQLALLAGWSAARAVPVLNVAWFRYARETGTGGLFAGGMPPWAPTVVLQITLAIGWLTGGWAGVGLITAVITLTLLVQAGIARKLGGLTGDVYGFGVEFAEMLALVAGCAIFGWIYLL